MDCRCPQCGQLVGQVDDREGLNCCMSCRTLFVVPPQRRVPPWVWGVVVILTANWQLLRLAC